MDAAIFAIIVIVILIGLYASRLLPIAATSIIGALLMVFSKILTFEECLAFFVDDVVLLQIGVMILGAAFIEVGLADDVGSFINKHFSKRNKILLLVLLIITVLMSSFLSNTATVAILIPIVISLEISSQKKIDRRKYLMPISFAAVLGGNITFFGSTPQMAVQSILNDNSIQNFTNLDLILTGLPLAILFILFYYFVLNRKGEKLFNSDSKIIEESTVLKENCPIYKKIIVIIIYLLCIVGFFTKFLPVGLTSILGGLLCVCTKCISEKKALNKIEWSTIIMLGAILAFSSGFSKSGAGDLIVNSLLSLFNNSKSPLLYFSILVVCGVLLTSVMSNTAVAAMLVPIGLSMASICNCNPMPFIIGSILSASISFMTPIATPCVAMTLSAGYKFRDYFIIGGLSSIICTIYIIVFVPLMIGF